MTDSPTPNLDRALHWLFRAGWEATEKNVATTRDALTHAMKALAFRPTIVPQDEADWPNVIGNIVAALNSMQAAVEWEAAGDTDWRGAVDGAVDFIMTAYAATGSK